MNNKVWIYGLFDPRTAECFYIGKTIKNLKVRLKSHINQNKGNNWKDRKIKQIITFGLKPIIAELLIIDDYYDPVLKKHFWEYVEMYYIQFTRDFLNEPLTNLKKGGGGEKPKPKLKHVKKQTVDLSRQVNQYTKYGEFINTYDSTIQAEIMTGVPLNGIRHCCNKKTKTSGGFLWSWYGDQITINYDYMSLYEHFFNELNS
jgi:hypothetical protein